MGKLNKIFLYFRNLFLSKSRKLKSARTKELRQPKGMAIELEELRNKLSNFLITRKKETGLITENKTFKLTKNASRLFRMEGTEKSGRKYSLVISTGNYLTEKDGVVNGLINLEEAELNRAIRSEYSNLTSLFSAFRDVELDEKSSAILQDLKSVFNWKSILNWKLFWKEQLFLYLNPNQTALLLVSLDENFRKLFMDTVSKKQKRIIQDELFFLNQGANSEELNPHSKNKGLFNFDSAEKELRRVIESLTARMEKENEL